MQSNCGAVSCQDERVLEIGYKSEGQKEQVGRVTKIRARIPAGVRWNPDKEQQWKMGMKLFSNVITIIQQFGPLC
jgi:hypothetical protein